MEPTDCLPEAGPAWSEAMASEDFRRRLHYEGLAEEAKAMGSPTVAQLVGFVRILREWTDEAERNVEDWETPEGSYLRGQALAYRVVADSLVNVYGVPE